MGKVSSKFKKGSVSIENRLVHPEAVNEQAFHMIANGFLINAVPMARIIKHKEVILTCTVDGYVPLKEYLKGVISKKTFFKIINDVIDMIRRCGELSMNSANLDLDPERVLIEPRCLSIYTVYWPVVNNQLAAPVADFFRNLSDLAKFPPNENNAFFDEYKRFFSDPSPFSFNNFEKLIMELQNSTPQHIHFSSGNCSFFAENETVPKAEPVGDVEYDPLAGVEIESDTAPDGQNTDDDQLIPVILRDSDNEVYVINTDNYVIGSSSVCNCHIAGNSHISRSHAAMVYEDGHFWLMDLGSTNGTFIDSDKLEPNVKVRIEVGTCFMLADEYFWLQARNASELNKQ